MSKRKKILLYGYGNPGRQDDGLGIAFIEKMEKWIKENQMHHFVETDCNYQLNIEDVEAIADKDLVIFIDASKEKINDWLLVPLDTSSHISFSMHSVSPGYLLHLSQELYGYQPKAYLLHIKGYSWEINEEMTATAQKNLEKAILQVKRILSTPETLDDLQEEILEMKADKKNT